MAIPTQEQALDNAARLLEQAEMELTNLPLMERLEGLADSWLGLAHMLHERERT
jgi:hypothetical protein